MPASPQRSVSTYPCPDPKHAGSKVIGWGKKQRKDGLRQYYLCTPVAGTAHRFSVVLTPSGDALPLFTSPPGCPEHPGAHVVRNGRYAGPDEKLRQIYLCRPADPQAKPHQFTPALSREHVHTGEDVCAECDEFRGTHHGELTAARQHSWPLKVVADGLRSLAEGKSYAEVSRAAREKTGRTRTRARTGPRIQRTVGNRDEPDPWALPADPEATAAEIETDALDTTQGEPPSLGSRLSRNAWHTAADWCEVFSPVLWEHLVTQLRGSEAKQRAVNDQLRSDGQVPDTPMVLFLDDIPVNTRTATGSKRDWFVLAASQTVWAGTPSPSGARERLHRLRLVRPSPSNDAPAWRLLLDELGYRPDVIVCDAGTGLLKAVAAHYRSDPVVVMPSLFHVREAVEEGLYTKTPGAWTVPVAGQPKQLRPVLAEHLKGLRKVSLRQMSGDKWATWWDDLFRILTSNGWPVEATLKRRANYEQAIADMLPALRIYPHLPASTGGLEVRIRTKIAPLLRNRGHGFANIERTSALMDLVVCHDHGMFNDMSEIVARLREDNNAHYGWATPLREVSDPGVAGQKHHGYSSLRDRLLLVERARKAGLS